MTREDVHAELWMLDRRSEVGCGFQIDDHFYPPGMALQDVITATIIYEKAVENQGGTVMKFA